MPLTFYNPRKIKNQLFIEYTFDLDNFFFRFVAELDFIVVQQKPILDKFKE